MHSPDMFRRKLAHRLRGIAEERRVTSNGQPSGEDLKVIARCERLSASAEMLDSRRCAALEDTFADPVRKHRFVSLWAELPDALGTTVWPADAAELVDWMMRQAEPEASRRCRPAAVPSTGKSEEPRSNSGAAALHRFAGSVAGDFTGGLAVVAPMLALWQTSEGLRAWHAASVVARHSAVTARILSVEPPRDARGSSPVHMATITFAPSPGAAACRATVDLGAQLPLNGTVAVVPRSGTCEAPLVPATIGDPTACFGLAAVFAVTGFVSLKAWIRLNGRTLRRPAPVPGTTPPMRVAL